MYRRLAATLRWALILALVPVVVHAESDLDITCGPEFAVFDRFVPGGRTMSIVPLKEKGQLEVAATIEMPPGQPHAWVLYRRYVIVRMWNEAYVYRLDDAFQPRQVASADNIDVERPNVGGTTEVRVNGSMLTVYGVGRTLKLDLAGCAERCELRPALTVETPPTRAAPRPCAVKRNGLLFAQSEATTAGDGVIYHDVFLTRRRTTPSGVRLVDNPFRPSSILYIGTRLETVD